MPEFFTYILYSEKLRKYYIGSTNDLQRRIADHNRGKTPFTMLVDEYRSQIPVGDLCKWTILPSSLYYYKPTGGSKGIKPSNHTGKQDGSMVAYEQVVDDIKTVLSRDFVCYRYHKVTLELRQMEYIIYAVNDQIVK